MLQEMPNKSELLSYFGIRVYRIIIFLLLGITANISCTPNTVSAMKTYQTDNYQFRYPANFRVTIKDKIVEISCDHGRIDIFKLADFNGYRMVGASSTGFEEYEYKFTPKLKKTFGPYSVWLFYQEGDAAGEKICRQILASFVLNEKGK
jgi:hypothetical protein